jgi:hypothetical protein
MWQYPMSWSFDRLMQLKQIIRVHPVAGVEDHVIDIPPENCHLKFPQLNDFLKAFPNSRYHPGAQLLTLHLRGNLR